MTRGRLFSGTEIDYDALHRGAIYSFDIRDIIVPLSRMPRYLGHTRRPISVLEHCTLVAELAIDLAREMGQPADMAARVALLHDAAEAFVGDLPAGLRAFLRMHWTGYDALEHAMLSLVFRQFGVRLTPELLALCERADYQARALEITALTRWPICSSCKPWSKRPIPQETPSEDDIRIAWLDLAVRVELITRADVDRVLVGIGVVPQHRGS